MEEKLLKIVNHYGVLNQLKYFQSEVFELNEAIMILQHYEEYANDQDYQTTLKIQKNHIAEEIADVTLMLKQFQYYYKISDEQIKKTMQFKADRQLNRIENEKLNVTGDKKLYDEVHMFGLDWYYLGVDDQGRDKFLLKNVLDEERIKKYADDEFMINCHDVRHSDSIRPFDWDKSYIKNVILPNFANDLEIDCEADLLSKEEVEDLPDKIKISNDCYWTKTSRSSNTTTVFFVNPHGNVGSYGVTTHLATRPVIMIKRSEIDG